VTGEKKEKLKRREKQRSETVNG